jgi:hypothetical protein
MRILPSGLSAAMLNLQPALRSHRYLGTRVMETTKAKVEKYGLQSTWVNDPALVRRFHDAYHELPHDVGDDSVATFFPASDGRFDYSTIVACARARLSFCGGR